MKRKIKIILGVVASFILIIIATTYIILINKTYKSEIQIDAISIEYSDITIVETSKEITFIPNENKITDDVLIFYPGALIEITSYMEIFSMLANEGITCIIVKMAFNLAITGKNKAARYMDDETKNYYISGHSLGGVMACSYALNSDGIKGIILLASYSDVDLSQKNIDVLSIYGSNDLILNMNNYNESFSYLPSNTIEYIIEGGNHSGFADYGLQNGDGENLIGNYEQKVITAERMKEFILG